MNIKRVVEILKSIDGKTAVAIIRAQEDPKVMEARLKATIALKKN